MFKPERLIFTLSLAHPIAAPSQNKEVSQARILRAICFPLSFSPTLHMMRTLLAQPSKDTQNVVDFTASNATFLAPTTIVSFT